MKVACHQPYFAPFLPYFQLISAVDYFVYRDDTQYTKKGYINRNSLWSNGGVETFTIPLKKAPHDTKITDMKISESFDREQFFRKIELEYSKAPYFKDFYAIMEHNPHLHPYTSISWASSYFIKEIFLYLNVDARVYHATFSFETDKPSSAGVLDIVKQVYTRFQENFFYKHSDNVLEYINSYGGKVLYSAEEFARNGVKLGFLKPHIPVYKDFRGRIQPGLSIIDVLMNNDPEQVREWLKMGEIEYA